MTDRRSSRPRAPRVSRRNIQSRHRRPLRLIGEALEANKVNAAETNDQAVFASKFENVKTLARHSLSQAVRRILENMDGELAAFTPHDLRRTAATLAQAARLPVDFIKALLNHNDIGVTDARWQMFEAKREAVLAIEAAVVPLMTQAAIAPRFQ